MNKSFKNWMYEFEATELIKKTDGSPIEKIKHKFAILKPNRRMKENGELFFATETSRFAKAGVLPRAAWNTILSNGGGPISDKEREVYGELLLKFRDLSFELQSILFKNESDRSELEKTKIKDLSNELEDIRKEIQAFESSQISIFENTAEAKARNRTILWWTLFLANKEVNGSYESLISGDSFEEKLDYYDSLEEFSEKNEFLLSVLKRITYLITLWFLGRAETKEEFDEYDKNFIKEDLKSEEKSEEKSE